MQWPPHPLLSDVPPPPLSLTLPTIRVTPEPVLVLHASRHPQNGDYVFYVSAWADYLGCRIRLAEDSWREQVVHRTSSGFTKVCREIPTELAAWKQLARADIESLRKLVPDAWRTLSPAPDTGALGHRSYCRGDADTFVALESRLLALNAAGFRLEYDPTLPFCVLPENTPLRATLREGAGTGWTQFEIATEVNGEQIDVLPMILAALRRKEFSLVPTSQEPENAHWLAHLGAQRFLPFRLSRLREWLAPLHLYLSRSPTANPTRIQVPDTQAMSLSECLRQQDVLVEGPQAAALADTLDVLRAAQRSPHASPLSFQGTLRHYQREGLGWLQALRNAHLGGILADDMGLGKTVQVIAHLLLEFESGRLDRPALIVAPTTLIFNWLDELSRFAPSLRCINFTGDRRDESRACLSGAHIIITSYALIIGELATLQALEYSMLVLDEAQWVKNPLARTARALRTLRASHKLAVTGTPLENHLGELWTHMDLVLPGYLGHYRSFNRAVRTPIEEHDDERRLGALRHLVAPFILRRTKAAVAPELPQKTETVLRIAMDPEQRRLYESVRLALSREVRDAFVRYSEEQSHIVVLAALMRLRQVCCDPRLIDPHAQRPPRSAKLDILVQLVSSLREQGLSVLIFSQFTSMLELIGYALRAEGFDFALLTGDTRDRRTPVQSFQSGNVSIFLASLKAGGLGLNLTAADVVIHFDPWWNPAVERQAEDRAHRIGREGPVFVYKLICEDTIEEKIASMKDRKSDLAHAVLGDGQNATDRLTEYDVRSLLDLPASPHL